MSIVSAVFLRRRSILLTAFRDEFMELLFVVVVAALALAFVTIKWQKAEELLKSQIKRTAECLTSITRMQQEIARLDKQVLQLDELRKDVARLDEVRIALLERITALLKYQHIIDAEAAAKDILGEASDTLDEAKAQAQGLISEARLDANKLRQQASEKASASLAQSEARLHSATQEAEKFIALAKVRATEIAGDAYAAMNRAEEFASTAQAMKNIIDGYGDAYIVPTYNLLDDLADEFGFTEAGQKLKAARETSRTMVKAGTAAACDYAENNRKEIAVRFVVDAFNGKVDSILSRGKSDNHGKLEQEIRDAYALVNHNGRAFRNARITEAYLGARLDELKWAVIAQALKEQARDEQRRLREQIREEEKARKEFERAIKDAAKEEDALRKAMEKVQAQVADANEAQRAEFEAKLLELQAKLQTAEDKNKRALSMAQQTRSGHVYVISNIGSFGEDMFKVGMTRRLEPSDRVRELGDASVPFEFDVHAMIFSDDAPGLEKSLHRHFLRQQVNKVNPRKEFFRLSLEAIRGELETLGIETQWTMTAAAHQFRETMKIEQQIRDNPAIEREWSRHQLEVEETVEAEFEAIELLAD